MKPWLLHTWAFRLGGCWFSTNKLLIHPTSLAGPVTFETSSMSRRRLLAVCFLSVFRFRLTLSLVAQAGSFSPLLKPSLLHKLASRRGVLVDIVIARTSPSLGGVVYDVHDCFGVSSTATPKKQLLLMDKHGY